jgi:hypothetical protein
VKREGRVILIIIVTLMVSALTFASDKYIVKIQGVVMAVDVKKNIVIVNERSFVCDQHTVIYNEKGTPCTIDKLKERGWVYIEGVPDRANRGNVAKKIYILPKYINEKEKHLYSFMD